MAADIGEIIFVQLLGMTQYPGSPFTGNIYRDIIMFLIVPTIFIILVIYTMAGRIAADPKIRVMLGVGAYLFLIASGYYSAFALLSGPYFIFLIFIMGLVYFVIGHFTGRAPQTPAGGGGGGPAAPGGRYAMGEDKKLRKMMGIPTLNPADRKYLRDRLKEINERIRTVEKQIEMVEKKPGTGDIGRLSEVLDRLIKERQQIDDKLQWG